MSREIASLMSSVKDRVEKAGVFAAVELRDGMLVCRAKNSAEPADYRIVTDAGRVWVELVTPNRWLSESIEAELEHTGDEVDELVEEELAELDYAGPALTGCQHFRSDDMLFTFRSPLTLTPGAPEGENAAMAATCLLAYEACFRRLGDMDAGRE